jgi:predicted RNase H-like HicB family nuclease
MTTYTFRVVVEPDEDRWRAYCPALEAQGAATWGYTREEALRHVREVIEMIAAELVEEGKPVPADGPISDFASLGPSASALVASAATPLSPRRRFS